MSADIWRHRFLQRWIALFAHSPATKLLWKTQTSFVVGLWFRLGRSKCIWCLAVCLWFIEEHPLSSFYFHICYILCRSFPLVTWAKTGRCIISTKLTDLILISAVLDGTQIFTCCNCGKVSGKHQQPQQDFSRILSRIFYLKSRIPSRQKSRIRLYVEHYPPVPTLGWRNMTSSCGIFLSMFQVHELEWHDLGNPWQIC